MNEQQSNTDEPKGSWIFWAKLRPPRQNIALIERPQLIERLNQSLDYQTCLVTAPAGYGKTTLLAQWHGTLSKRGVRAGWLTLDDGDSDAQRFLSYVICSLTAAGVDLGQLSMLAEQGLADLSADSALAAMLESIDKSDQNIALVLDDYHRAASEEIDEQIERLITNAPKNFRVVINSRIAPTFSSSYLVATGRALMLDAEALRFSEAEMRRAFDEKLSEQQLTQFHATTEGWPVAIQLARIAIREIEPDALLDSFGQRSGHLASFLADQVFGDLPNEAQEFLLHTSILEQFNSGLANAVNANENSRRVLKSLEHLGALIVADDMEGGWYRYHHLFADFLYDQLKTSEPTLIPKLHQRASTWFELEGDTSAAVKHAKHAGEIDRCATLIQDAGGWEIILYRGIAQLRDLLRHVSDLDLTAYPRLLLAQSYLLVKKGETQRSRALFDAAVSSRTKVGNDPQLDRDIVNLKTLLDVYEDRLDSRADLKKLVQIEENFADDDYLAKGIFGCTEASVAMSLGRFDESSIHVRNAMRSMRQADTILGLNYCYLHAAMSNFYRCEFQQAKANAIEASSMARDNFGADSGLKSLADVIHGALRYWTDELDVDDEKRFFAALEFSEKNDGWFEIYGIGIEAELGLGLERQDFDAAIRAVDRAERISSARGIDRLEQLAVVYRLDVFTQAGERREAARTATKIERFTTVGQWRKSPVTWRTHEASCRVLAVHFASKDRDKSKAYIQDALECNRDIDARFHLVRTLITNSILKSLWGEREAALQSLFDALSLASANGVKKPFELSKAIVPLMWQALSWGRSEAMETATLSFLSSVLDSFHRRSSEASAGIPLLSPRENEVLMELSQGRSNKQIARALNMTEHTVKFHLKNVFAKLEVSRRAEAVAVARNIGLVP